MNMANPRIFFISPDINSPTGGIKQLYRQVDVLNNNGYNAFILHQNAGFKCSWFVNQTKIVYNYSIHQQINFLTLQNSKVKGIIPKIKQFVKSILKKITKIQHSTKNDIVVQTDDIFVFPEVYGKLFGRILMNNKKVIYNQNCYYTFNGCSYLEETSPYFSKNVLAIIVASLDAFYYVNYSFPTKKLLRVKYGIDEKVFNYSHKKKQQIAFMPRKLNEDVVQVINILNLSGKLKNWELKVIDKMNEKEVADSLKESTFFLSFNHREGFGMPPAEAMACGCVVVGYAGKGGKEFFKEDFCYPIEDRDVLSFAKTLENVIKEYENDNTPFIEKGKKASDFILSEYSMEMEVKTIIDCWNQILN
jgi:hypothetical protein